MVKLERIELEDFTQEDINNLQLALKTDPAGNPELVYTKLSTGKAIPWRYSTPKGNILLILEENQDKKEKYIFVWYMGGKGMLGNAQYAVDALVEYAKIRECKSVRSFSIPVIAKYLKRFDFIPQMVALRKEI